MEILFGVLIEQKKLDFPGTESILCCFCNYCTASIIRSIPTHCPVLSLEGLQRRLPFSLCGLNMCLTQIHLLKS